MDINDNFIHNKYGWCYYWIKNDTALVHSLVVEPEYRRRGHAKHLLGLVMAEIRNSGYSGEIQIEALPEENSIDKESLIAFYKSMGLKVINS